MNALKKITFSLCTILVFSMKIGAGEWIKIPPKLIALTFDDGPRPVSTTKFLAILKRHQVKATFFVVGEMAEKYPEYIGQMLSEGHEISNHTWSHPLLKTLTKKMLTAELTRTQDFLFNLTGQRTWLFRPPGGSLQDWKNKMITPNGFTMVLWNVHAHDQEGISAQKIVSNVLSQAKENDIILLHNGLPATAHALDVIIPVLKKRGFVFVSVSELIKKNQRQLAVVDGPKLNIQ